MQSELNYRVVRLRHRDVELLESLDTLHRALVHGSNSATSPTRTATGSPPPPEQFMDFVTKRLRDETMLLVFALAGDTPIGYSLAFDVAEHPFMPEWRRSGYITQMFVASEHRRRGVGRLLFDSTIRWLASRGVTNVLLNVSVDNPEAEQFWRKQGFAPHLMRMKRKITPQL